MDVAEAMIKYVLRYVMNKCPDELSFFNSFVDKGLLERLEDVYKRQPQDLQNLVLALLNQQYDREGLVFRHVSSLHLETQEELPWSLDGEYAASVPAVEIENHQRSLTMLL